MRASIRKHAGLWQVTRNSYGFTREPVNVTTYPTWRAAMRAVTRPQQFRKVGR